MMGLQQKQRKPRLCSFFAVANAVAVANGVDPNTVSWHQDSMRQHLRKCFEQTKVERFPHNLKQAPSAALQSHYVVSIYCLCLKHIPGAQMVCCTVCGIGFIMVTPRVVIKTLLQNKLQHLQQMLLLSEYCEIDKQKKKDNPHTSVVI